MFFPSSSLLTPVMIFMFVFFFFFGSMVALALLLYVFFSRTAYFIPILIYGKMYATSQWQWYYKHCIRSDDEEKKEEEEKNGVNRKDNHFGCGGVVVVVILLNRGEHKNNVFLTVDVSVHVLEAKMLCASANIVAGANRTTTKLTVNVAYFNNLCLQ